MEVIGGNQKQELQLKAALHGHSIEPDQEEPEKKEEEQERRQQIRNQWLKEISDR